MKKAFTLIELLIVIGVISVLTVAFLPNALSAPAKARDAGRIKTVNDIAAALETYRGSTGQLPPPQDADCLALPGVTQRFADSLGGTLPGDPTGLQACSSNVDLATAGTNNLNPYLYVTFASNRGGYIVAAKMENSSSGNVFVTAVTAVTAGDTFQTAVRADANKVSYALMKVAVDDLVAAAPAPAAPLQSYYYVIGK